MVSQPVFITSFGRTSCLGSSSSAYPGPGRRCSIPSREPQTLLSSATSTSSSGGIPKASREMKSLQHVLGLPWGLLLDGHAQNTYPGRCLGGILTRCPNHLNWLLSTWRSSGSTLSSIIKLPGCGSFMMTYLTLLKDTCLIFLNKIFRVVYVVEVEFKFYVKVFWNILMTERLISITVKILDRIIVT